VDNARIIIIYYVVIQGLLPLKGYRLSKYLMGIVNIHMYTEANPSLQSVG